MKTGGRLFGDRRIHRIRHVSLSHHQMTNTRHYCSVGGGKQLVGRWTSSSRLSTNPYWTRAALYMSVGLPSEVKIIIGLCVLALCAVLVVGWHEQATRLPKRAKEIRKEREKEQYDKLA